MARAMTDWKICENSCCVLVKKGVDAAFGQGILLCHSEPGRKTYWLLTCHHVITSKAASQGFYVHVFNGKSEKCFKLDKSSVGNFYSCCGENGILGEAEHFYKSDSLRPSLFPLPHSPFKNGIFGEAEPFYKPRPLVSPPRPRCPFDLDSTLMEVKGPHVKKILSCIEVIDINLCVEASGQFVSGSILSLLQEQNAEECYFYQRDKERYSKVKYKEHYLQLSWPVPRSQKLSVLRGWGSKMSCFNVDVTEDDKSEIFGAGSSGAPIYVIHKNKKPLLIGMHIGTGRKNHRNMQSSLNINFLWVLKLLMANGPHVQNYSSRLLWAIFLQYENVVSKTKDASLLLAVAKVIRKQLTRSPEQEQLNDNEEIEMFDKIQHFCKLQ